MQMHLFPFYVVSEFIFYSLSEKKEYLFMPEVNMFPIVLVLSIYKFGLSVCLFVCLFVSKKRQNG